MKITENKQSKLRHCIYTTKRFLRKARDFYVDSMVNFEGKVPNANAVACQVAHASHHLPMNFGPQRPLKLDNNENIEELYKSFCKKYNWSDMDFGKVKLKQRGGECRAIDRSYSVALGRIGTIDEEEPCEFEDDVPVMFPRSRSHAVTRKNNGFYY